MKYNLDAFESLVRDGYLKKAEKGDLVLYGYTDKTTFERAWDTKYTLHARGLILNKKTGEVVAKPFPKFFNLGENNDSHLLNLPKEPYEVFEKCDGSLGIIFHHNGVWQIATRGSFSSEQAIRATLMLQEYDIYPNIPIYTTLLVEIIYPENKIIVDYKGEEKLVLLGAYDRSDCSEYDSETVQDFALKMGMPMAQKFRFTIDQMIALQKTLPKDDEGFVVRFQSGLRVKIKGDEYMKIAKIISHMSPISFWESMDKGKVKTEYLQQLPEEFRSEYEPMIQRLESLYEKVLFEIATEHTKLPITELKEKEDRKTLGLFLSGPNGLKHSSVMFALLMKKYDTVDSYIMKQIRPTGNVLT